MQRQPLVSVTRSAKFSIVPYLFTHTNILVFLTYSTSCTLDIIKNSANALVPYLQLDHDFELMDMCTHRLSETQVAYRNLFMNAFIHGFVLAFVQSCVCMSYKPTRMKPVHELRWVSPIGKNAIK